jgi:hypothetical protein
VAQLVWLLSRNEAIDRVRVKQCAEGKCRELPLWRETICAGPCGTRGFARNLHG